MTENRWKGCFTTSECCSRCDYFGSPPTYAYRYYIERDVCPKCGDKIETHTGQYIMEETKGFLGMFKTTRYVGFEKKTTNDKQLNKPKPTDKPL